MQKPSIYIDPNTELFKELDDISGMLALGKLDEGYVRLRDMLNAAFLYHHFKTEEREREQIIANDIRIASETW